jgi:hypothetical protein
VSRLSLRSTQQTGGTIGGQFFEGNVRRQLAYLAALHSHVCARASVRTSPRNRR